MQHPDSATRQKRFRKAFSEFGPLIGFFTAFQLYDLLVATAVLIGLTAVGLILIWVTEKRIPVTPLITAVLVGIFGGLTLVLQDERFIKMKPTLISLLFAAILFGGLLRGKALLKHVMGMNIELTETAWRQLSLRYGLFFCSIAALNEYVWRLYSTDLWVNFKVFGLFGCTIIFTLSQLPFLKQHSSVPQEK
jgi:intracellular septation protein